MIWRAFRQTLPVAFVTTAALLPSLGAAQSTASVPQSVTTVELQRYIYAPAYPTWCGASGQAARDMRVNPTTDPVRLHAVMQANIEKCANTSFAKQNPPLWNTAVFAAAAAALLAARNEPAAQALQDATHAKNWSSDIAGFTHQPGAGRPGPGSNLPSMYRTNAGRITTDAVALISALTASGPSATASPDALPDHVPAPAGAASPNPAASPSR